MIWSTTKCNLFWTRNDKSYCDATIEDARLHITVEDMQTEIITIDSNISLKSLCQRLPTIRTVFWICASQLFLDIDIIKFCWVFIHYTLNFKQPVHNRKWIRAVLIYNAWVRFFLHNIDLYFQFRFSMLYFHLSNNFASHRLVPYSFKWNHYMVWNISVFCEDFICTSTRL